MEPGAYYYNRDARAFELLKPGNFPLEAGYLRLEQPLGMDCSALIVYMADLERALHAFGNRGYGDAHLEAGILGGRAYLKAYPVWAAAQPDSPSTTTTRPNFSRPTLMEKVLC